MKAKAILMLLVAVCVMLAMQTRSFAGSLQGKEAGQNKGGTISPNATSKCKFTFTSGADNTFIKYCVTANGNITQFESPEGHEHIQVFDVVEGYGICDFTDADHNVSYFDYADQGDSRNWGLVTVLSNTAKSIKLARTTSDGFWTLTQTIAEVTGSAPAAQITMALKNNTGKDRDVVLLRTVDVDADGQISNNLDATLSSAFGWNSSISEHGYGLVLQDAGTTQSGLFLGTALPTPNSPDPCMVDTSLGPFTNTDGTILMEYGLIIPKGGTKTVKLAYRAF